MYWPYFGWLLYVPPAASPAGNNTHSSFVLLISESASSCINKSLLEMPLALARAEVEIPLDIIFPFPCLVLSMFPL